MRLPGVRPVVCVLRSSETNLGLTRALGELATVIEATEFSELAATLRFRRADAVVVEASGGAAAMAVSALRTLRCLGYISPTMAVLVPGPGCSRYLVDLVEAGASSLVLFGTDDCAASLMELLKDPVPALARATARQLLSEVARGLPAAAYSLLREVVRAAREGASVDQLCRRLGVPHRTLARRFERIGLASPGCVLRSSRVCLAARMLAEGHGVARVARQLGYSSRGALCFAMKALLGVLPREARNVPWLAVLRFFRQSLGVVGSSQAPVQATSASKRLPHRRLSNAARSRWSRG